MEPGLDTGCLFAPTPQIFLPLVIFRTAYLGASPSTIAFTEFYETLRSRLPEGLARRGLTRTCMPWTDIATERTACTFLGSLKCVVAKKVLVVVVGTLLIDKLIMLW